MTRLLVIYFATLVVLAVVETVFAENEGYEEQDSNVPRGMKCGNTTCEPGYVCKETPLYICRRPGCPKPPTRLECVPAVNPCAYTTCKVGYDCIPSDNDPTAAECRPRDPCADVDCKPGYKCEVVAINCLVAPCPPPCVKCVPTTPNPCLGKPCGDTVCQPGEECQEIFVNCLAGSTCTPPPPRCIPTTTPAPATNSSCDKVRCQAGYVCKETPLYICRRPGCPKPPTRAECVPAVNPCAYTTCKVGYDCIPSDTDPTAAECRPRDPCAVVDCKPGYKCEVVTIYCLVAPCPHPYAKCVRIPPNPCSCKTCGTGEICTQTKDDPTVAECVMDPCATIRCGFNTTCKTYVKECYSAPCSKPIGKCVPLNKPC